MNLFSFFSQIQVPWSPNKSVSPDIPFNLEKGDSPLLIVLFIILVSLLCLQALVYLGYLLYKKMKFKQICSVSGFNGQEVGVFQDFIRRFHYPNPLMLLVRRSYFDGFINQIAHYYSATRLSEKELLKESSFLSSIRKKLKFIHNFKAKALVSSRAFPRNFPMQLMFRDESVNYTFTFTTKVYRNFEFFMVIEPPDDKEMETYILRKPRATFEVEVIRENDSAYFFNTYLVRPSLIFEKKWLIQHSQKLIEGDSQKSIKLILNILCEKKEGDELDEEQEKLMEVQELGGTITLLTKSAITFFLDQEVNIFEGTCVLMNFDLLGNPTSFQGTVEKVYEKGGHRMFKVPLKGLDENTKLSITKFLYKAKSESEQES